MKTLKQLVPIEIQEIVQKLSEKYEVYFVGGCVRDFLLGKKIHDFDCTTSATVDEMKEQLSEFKIIETGIQHGTLTIMNNYQTVEITTYRIDSKYINHRSPVSVEFTRNIEEDLKRRDFTINALACDLDGNMLDYHDGLKDLENKIIRCVGDPMKRFNEDALRILRAIRFSCTLGFNIEENTKQAIHHSLHLLEHISIERKRDELFKILCTNKPYSIIKEYDLLDVYELPYHPCMHELDHSIHDLTIRIANLFYTSKTCRQILKKWHCSKKMMDEVTILVDSRHEFIENDRYPLRKYIYEVGIENTKKILLFKHMSLDLLHEIIETHDYLDELNINGQDLIELGYSGKDIKVKLDECIDLVLHDLSLNNSDILKERMRR